MVEIAKSAINHKKLNELDININNFNENSFERLSILQKLIKRESALKELCKKIIK